MRLNIRFLHKIAVIEESSCLFVLGYRPNPTLDSAVFNSVLHFRIRK